MTTDLSGIKRKQNQDLWKDIMKRNWLFETKVSVCYGEIVSQTGKQVFVKDQ